MKPLITTIIVILSIMAVLLAILVYPANSEEPSFQYDVVQTEGI